MAYVNALQIRSHFAPQWHETCSAPLPVTQFGDGLSRWSGTNLKPSEVLIELDRSAAVLADGVEVLRGIYLRICDLIRDYNVSDIDARRILSKHFPPPRVSEFLLVARAPNEVYRRYRAQLVGFKATLDKCRGYSVNSSDQLRRRKLLRTAARLCELAGQGTVRTGPWVLTIKRDGGGVMRASV